MQTQHPVCAWGQDEAAAEDTCWQQRQEQVVEQQQQAGLPPCKKHKVCSTSNGNSAAATQHALCDCSSSLHDGPLDAASAAGTSDGCTNGSSQAAAAAAANGRVDWSNKPYLCTGYDCFLAREPCIMCSMGMVHSRLARVVYCQPDPQHGALGGKLRLHAHRSLNHHYLVYQLPVKDPSHQ
jgi:tRNA-specific adenosine deaminase 3